MEKSLRFLQHLPVPRIFSHIVSQDSRPGLVTLQASGLKTRFFLRESIKNALVYAILCLSTLQLSAANPASPQPDKEAVWQQMLSDPNFQQLMNKQAETNTHQSADPEQVVALAKQQRKERLDFYRDYLTTFFPKAMVMCGNYFLTMQPEAIAASLRNVIDMFANDPWLYFSNQIQGFKLTHYWEYIIDQLSMINNFISNALINQKTGAMWVPNEDEMLLNWTAHSALFKNSTPLNDQLVTLKETSIYDFYALCFDYLIKLFNEGVLLQDIGQAMLYFSELEFIIGKLQGSIHEQEYQERMTTCKELLSLLKEKLGIGDHSDDMRQR